MSDPTHGLYPFLDETPAGWADRSAARAPESGLRLRVAREVSASTMAKAHEVSALRRSLLYRHAADILRASRLCAQAFAGGGKVLAFGNGGSATDAQDLVADFTQPRAGRRALPALCLAEDRGVLTAVANDVGPAHVFLRQVIALGDRGDVAVGFSTSGRSPSVVEALREARGRGLRTVAFTGYDGGDLAGADWVDALIVAPSSHVPRIQEAHATAYHTLVELVHLALGSGSVVA